MAVHLTVGEFQMGKEIVTAAEGLSILAQKLQLTMKVLSKSSQTVIFLRMTSATKQVSKRIAAASVLLISNATLSAGAMETVT